MSAGTFAGRMVAAYLHSCDGHDLADVLKACAEEIQTRGLPGHQLVYDVAFEIHAVISHERIAEAVRRTIDGPPPP
jgi:hypothetical protein